MSDARSKPSATGYSGKPLWQKLGLRARMRVRLMQAPAAYWDWCDMDAADVDIVAAPARNVEFAHVFATSRSALERDLQQVVPALASTGMLWISWPKKSAPRKAARIETDITEGTLRELALPLGLVDVKVCAVTEVWSGLKFVWRVERRAAIARKSS